MRMQLLHTPGPVSYTHLDVYKRQTDAQAGTEGKTAQDTPADGSSAAPSSADPSSGSTVSSDGSSYTIGVGQFAEQDVYKRQGPGRGNRGCDSGWD